MTSVAIRSPESSSVMRWAGRALAPVGIPVASRRALAVAIAVTAAPAAVAAVAATAAAAALAAAATVAAAGADRGQLLLGLARDVRVLGETQADAPALAVD